MGPGDDAPDRSQAESIYARFLAEGDGGRFEALLADHPELAPALREVHDDWRRTEGVLRQLSFEESVRLGDRDGAASRAGGPAAERAGFERYVVGEEVGHGGMGSVLRAWDEELRRPVALKIARASNLGGDAEGRRMLRRFLNEARITGQLDHPGIVPVHELGRTPDGRPFFAMKLVEGSDLQAVFERARGGDDEWTLTRVVGVLQRACEALAYAHSKGVLHRDLKPANVMVGRFGEVYVMDWGLARYAGDGGAGAGDADAADAALDLGEESPADALLRTRDGHVVGTPAYLSPEQAEGRIDDMGPHTDVYAIGAMLYQLLSGHVPYVEPGETPSGHTVVERVRRGPPPPLAALPAPAPPELAAICNKAMEREPSARYATMAELSADLRAYLEGRVVPAFERGFVATARKWVRRNPMLSAAAAVVLVLTVGTVLLGRKVRANEAARNLESRRAARSELASELRGLRETEFAFGPNYEFDDEALRARIVEILDDAGHRLGDLDGERLLDPHHGESEPEYERTVLDALYELAECDRRMGLPSADVDAFLARWEPDPTRRRLWTAYREWVAGPDTEALRLEEALGESPTADQLEWTGLLLYRSRRLSESEPYFRRAMTTDRSRFWPYGALATIGNYSGDRDLAALSRTAVGLNPKSAWAWFHLGLHERTTDLEAAIGAFRRVIELRPDTPPAYVNLALLLPRAEGLRLLLHAKSTGVESELLLDNLVFLASGLLPHEEWLALAREQIDLYPDWAPAHYHAGRALDELGRSEEAMHEFARALSSKRGALRGARARQALYSHTVACQETAYALDEDEEDRSTELLLDALESAERAAEMYPNEAGSHLNMATTLTALARYREALEHWRPLLHTRRAAEVVGYLLLIEAEVRESDPGLVVDQRKAVAEAWARRWAVAVAARLAG